MAGLASEVAGPGEHGSYGPRAAAAIRVALRDVAKHFGGVTALDGISVEVEPGTVHALVGENGAGKSTLGKIVAGALAPDAGALVVDGEE
ncbi:MAG: ATP-binding cassette domain-containing protein, partial [Solirubrobacteraceae bacterium]